MPVCIAEIEISGAFSVSGFCLSAFAVYQVKNTVGIGLPAVSILDPRTGIINYKKVGICLPESIAGMFKRKYPVFVVVLKISLLNIVVELRELNIHTEGLSGIALGKEPDKSCLCCEILIKIVRNLKLTVVIHIVFLICSHRAALALHKSGKI